MKEAATYLQTAVSLLLSELQVMDAAKDFKDTLYKREYCFLLFNSTKCLSENGISSLFPIEVMSSKSSSYHIFMTHIRRNCCKSSESFHNGSGTANQRAAI